MVATRPDQRTEPSLALTVVAAVSLTGFLLLVLGVAFLVVGAVPTAP